MLELVVFIFRQLIEAPRLLSERLFADVLPKVENGAAHQKHNANEQGDPQTFQLFGLLPELQGESCEFFCY